MRFRYFTVGLVVLVLTLLSTKILFGQFDDSLLWYKLSDRLNQQSQNQIGMPPHVTLKACNACLEIPSHGYCDIEEPFCVPGDRDNTAGCPIDKWRWNTCNATEARHTYFNDMLVMIYFNGDHTERIPLLRNWSRAFPNLFFTGNGNPRGDLAKDWWHCPEGLGRGSLWYRCIIKMIETYPEYDGYLAFHFDVVVNYWQFEKRNVSRDKFWSYYGPVHSYDYNVWHWPRLMPYVTNAKKNFPNFEELEKKLGGDWRRGGWADFTYIPKKHSVEWCRVGRLFSEAGVFHEVAIAMITAITAVDHPEDVFQHNSPHFMESNHHAWNPNDFAYHRVDLVSGAEFMHSKVWSPDHAWTWKGVPRVPPLTLRPHTFAPLNGTYFVL